MRLQLFNQFNEKFDFNKLSDEELDDVKKDLIQALEELKLGILQNIEYNTATNKIVFKKDFKNIDVNFILGVLNKEFGEDSIRELNVEALLRKISQIIVLKKRNTRRRIKEEFPITLCHSMRESKDKKKLFQMMNTSIKLKVNGQFFQERNTKVKNMTFKLS